MRYLPIAAALLLSAVLCASAPSAIKVNPTAPPIVSPSGLEGIREVFVDAQLLGDPGWAQAVKLDQKQFRGEVEARVRRIPGLRITSDRGMNTPRLLVQVMGHTIPGFPGSDPPAATHMTLALIQPVILPRRGPAGQAIVTAAACDESSMFSSGKVSTMRERVKAKVSAMLDEFARDYARANPKVR